MLVDAVAEDTTYSAGPHSRAALHVLLPASSWYAPTDASQAMHVGVVPGMAGPEHTPDSRCPTPHAAATVHVVHTVSVDAVLLVDVYCVWLHTVAVTQAVWPALEANVPAAHAVHTGLPVAVLGPGHVPCRYCPAVHAKRVVQLLHTRSTSVVGALT